MIHSALITQQLNKEVHIPNRNQSCIPCARNRVDFIHLLYQHSQKCGSHSKFNIVLLLVVLNEPLISPKLMWLSESGWGNHAWLCVNSRSYHGIRRWLGLLLVLCLCFLSYGPYGSSFPVCSPTCSWDVGILVFKVSCLSSIAGLASRTKHLSSPKNVEWVNWSEEHSIKSGLRKSSKTRWKK